MAWTAARRQQLRCYAGASTRRVRASASVAAAAARPRPPGGARARARRWRCSRGRPPSTLDAPARAPAPAAARDTRGARRRGRRSGALTGTRALVLERKAASATVPTAASAAPRELERLALALAGHDPQRTLERGYALVQTRGGRADRHGATGASGGRGEAALRRRRRSAREVDASDERRCRRSRERLSYEAAAARVEEIIRRLDSGEASLGETLELVKRGQGADRVLRGRAGGRRRRPGGAAPGRARGAPGTRGGRERQLSTWERLAGLPVRDRGLRAGGPRAEGLERLRTQVHGDPPARRRRRRAWARTSPTTPRTTRSCRQPGPRCRSPASGRWHPSARASPS